MHCCFTDWKCCIVFGNISQSGFVLCQQNVSEGKTQVLYSLYGIVEHSGTMRSGHYTAYVKARPHCQSMAPNGLAMQGRHFNFSVWSGVCDSVCYCKKKVQLGNNHSIYLWCLTVNLRHRQFSVTCASQSAPFSVWCISKLLWTFSDRLISVGLKFVAADYRIENSPWEIHFSDGCQSIYSQLTAVIQ